MGETTTEMVVDPHFTTAEKGETTTEMVVDPHFTTAEKAETTTETVETTTKWLLIHISQQLKKLRLQLLQTLQLTGLLIHMEGNEVFIYRCKIMWNLKHSCISKLQLIYEKIKNIKIYKTLKK